MRFTLVIPAKLLILLSLQNGLPRRKRLQWMALHTADATEFIAVVAIRDLICPRFGIGLLPSDLPPLARAETKTAADLFLIWTSTGGKQKDF